MKSKGLKVCVN